MEEYKPSRNRLNGERGSSGKQLFRQQLVEMATVSSIASKVTILHADWKYLIFPRFFKAILPIAALLVTHIMSLS